MNQQIISPGKGGAFIQAEMRDSKSGMSNAAWIEDASCMERAKG